MKIESLEQLIKLAEPIIERIKRGDASVRDLQALVREAIQETEFVLDAFRSQVQCLMDPRPTKELHADDIRAFRIRMICWPAGHAGVPHEHHTWTVAAVLHGSLELSVYERCDGHLELVRSATCAPGQVGYLVPPCIHTFRNPLGSTSISLHVFNHDGNDQQHGRHTHHEADWFAGKDRLLPRSQYRRLALEAVIRAVSSLGTPGVSVIEQAFELPDRHVRLAATKAAYRIDRNIGDGLILRLASSCSEPDRSRLLQLAGRLRMEPGL